MKFTSAIIAAAVILGVTSGASMLAVSSAQTERPRSSRDIKAIRRGQVPQQLGLPISELNPEQRARLEAERSGHRLRSRLCGERLDKDTPAPQGEIDALRPLSSFTGPEAAKHRAARGVLGDGSGKSY